ncbi:hypothetical protein FW320_03100 [Azospirillum sp. Vi22]|nr:hypothetical protein [Azospirillum baldaniorum]
MNEHRPSSLRRSVARQARILDGSILLTPVDSFALHDPPDAALDRLEGLYATDRPRGLEDNLKSKILFSGRRRLSHDITAIYRQWSEALGADDLSMRLLSGLHAHATIFMGLGRVGETVFLLPEKAGGHFATAGILERLGYRVVELPIDLERHRVDMERAKRLVDGSDGGILFIDRSEGLVYEDFGPLTENPALYCVHDASQYLPAILTGRYRSPFAMGFDLLISTLHKSFPGPQKALVATRTRDERWERVKRVMSQFVSSHHVRSTYLAGLGLEDMGRLERYTDRFLENAVALEQALADLGIDVVRRAADAPPTQHLWIRFDSAEAAYEACRRLELCRIHSNYRLLPYGLGYGLRLGTTAATLQGLRPTHVPRLAQLLGDILSGGFTLSRRHAVRELASAMADSDDLRCPSPPSPVLFGGVP